MESTIPICMEVIKAWGEPYRGWEYYPDPVISSDYKIPGAEGFYNYDVPCVYQVQGKSDIWYMSFIGFNGSGYNSFIVESLDLIHWQNPRLAMGFGREGDFDFGGCVVGAYLYGSWDIKAPRLLKKKDNKYWTLYGCYANQGAYELPPGYQGVAASDDGLTWKRYYDEPILSVHQASTKPWEKYCIYQPWVVEHGGLYYNFYNAADSEKNERMGLAYSDDFIHWVRYPFNPIIDIHPNSYNEKFSSDGKVFRDGDHWIQFYFGVGMGGASIMAAFSQDLVHWTEDPEPLYKFGGHPTGLDKTYAHKISLVYNPKDRKNYMFYCAVGNKGRTIGLLRG